MNNLPIIALSLIQPWAWLVANGYKNIENRPRRILRNIDRPILIHASHKKDKHEFQRALQICWENPGLWDLKVTLNNHIIAGAFDFGGIVGVMTLGAEVIDPSERRKSPWYFGPHGYRVTSAKTLPFKPCKGHLGFFHCNYDAI